MHHSGHAKLHKKFKKSISKWWYVGAVVAFTVIANFIGLIVFLGLSTTENESTTLPTETQTYRITPKPREHRYRQVQPVQVVSESIEEVTESLEDEAHVAEVPQEDDNNTGELPGSAESLVAENSVFVDLNSLSHKAETYSSSSEDVTLIPDDADHEDTSTLRVQRTEQPPSTITFAERTTRPNTERSPTTPTPVSNHRFEKRLMQVDSELDATAARLSEEYIEKRIMQQEPAMVAKPTDEYIEERLIQHDMTTVARPNVEYIEKRFRQPDRDLDPTLARPREEYIEKIQDFKPLYDPKKIYAKGIVKDKDRENELYSVSRLSEGVEHSQDGALIPVVDGGEYLNSNYSPMRYDNEDPETGTNPFSLFLQGGLQDIYEWISSEGSHTSSSSSEEDGDTGSMTQDFKEVLRAVNSSIVQGNSSILLWKLKEMYNTGDNDAVVNITDPSVLSNSSSLVSVGLLAFDLLLLYNVQQIAWEDQDATRVAMLRDPEVVAMNALFLSPAQLRELQEPGPRVEKKEGGKGVLEEALGFVNSVMRAVLALGRAYRSSKEGERQETWNTLDCVWTLYCRNLDKTARLPGLYGFLAKMNSLGLRLVMGDFPVEHALDLLIGELMRGSAGINCEKIFPKCSPKTAVDVVMRKAIGIRSELPTSDVTP